MNKLHISCNLLIPSEPISSSSRPLVPLISQHLCSNKLLMSLLFNSLQQTVVSPRVCEHLFRVRGKSVKFYL